MQTELHTPLRGATPTQIEQARKKRERDQRIAMAAERLAQSKIVELAPPVVPAVDPEVAAAEWVERQLALMPMKETWFSIVEEIRTEPVRPRVEKIQRETMAYFEMPSAAFFSERRTANLVRARQVAMYLAKTLTTKSLPEIGRRFGGKDHTTVLHAVRKIEKLLPSDMTVSDAVETIKAKLGGDQ
ncbi:MAG: chromosomal replication initiator protein DnaA [Rhizobium sp.]|nr:chromosomal replication initiator protein DnaA [Rhizobium sp.]